MFLRRLSLVLCAAGFIASTAAWGLLLERPAHATNCTQGCGPDSNSCRGATVDNCSGNCFSGACNGNFVLYQNTPANGTVAGGIPITTTPIACVTRGPCTNGTLTKVTCTWILAICGSSSATGTCSDCWMWGGTTSTYPQCVPGTCTEG